MKKFVPREVHPDDVDYVLRMLSRTALTEGVRSSKQYSIKYRLLGGREISNRRIRAVLSRETETEHIFLGVINIDADIAREKEHREEIDFMRQKERNYLAAVLGSAEGYIEANLTADKVTEYSEFFASMWDMIEGVAKPQRDITYTEINNCRDCYRCVRHCPVKAIQIKDAHAEIIYDRCTFCGTCVNECPNSVKVIRNDTDKVRMAFLSKRRVIV